MRYLLATVLVAAALLAGSTGAAFAGRGDGSDAPAAEPKVTVSSSGSPLFGTDEPVRAVTGVSITSDTPDNKRNLAR
ncbi:MAG: hypothetical protein HY660_07660 [Armatimonadetes bacterium]|nr:hypothetical protein [Armatimonadota bacterium]